MTAEVFHEVRMKHRLSRRKFAEILGLKSRQTVWRYETGQRSIPGHTAQLVILHFGTNKQRRELEKTIDDIKTVRAS